MSPMSPMLIGTNIVSYALQIGLVVGLGALVPAALRMRIPRARLLYWQVLLVACLALPWIRNWREEVVVASTALVSNIVTTAPAVSATPLHRTIPFPSFVEIGLWLLATGIAIRLVLLVAGLLRLAGYRERGRTMTGGVAPGVALLISDEVESPVTFGWRDPVILLPTHFPSLQDEMREAVLCHELLHVARRDWLFTIVEELVRAVLWFHPAVWWVIGEIQLAREQTVDRAVIETTRASGPYVDALLLMAGAGVDRTPQLDLAPAPMFLRRRHLRKRLMEVVREAQMSTISKTRLACVMSAAVIMVIGVSWLATGAFPLAAAPQVVDDAAGIAVNLNGSQLLHRSPVSYPVDALAKGVEGTVVVQLKLDATGEVSDAAVLSGPDELRKGVLQSVLNWHFDRSEASTTRTVNIGFVKPAAASPALPQLIPNEQLLRQTMPKMAPRPPLPPPPPTSGKLDHIVVTGLSDSARAELLAGLPIREGGEWTNEMFAAVRAAVNKFDSHLTVGLGQSASGEATLRIGLLASATPSNIVMFGGGSGSGGAIPQVAAPLPASGVYSVGNGVSPPTVLSKVDPQYTEQARAAKYSGSVMLSIVVGTDGKATNVQVVKSLGMGLDENAVACVQQWVFRPAMNSGVPVNVRAQIEINFRLLNDQ
jgi:TonB family protein